jgi:hypothetical protein
VLEEVVPHEEVVALWILLSTHILVHVEGFHVFKGSPFLQYSISFL